MNRLGLKINRVESGLTTLLSENGGDCEEAVLMLSRINEGVILTIALPIKARHGDYIAAAIYLLYNIKLENKELAGIVDELKKELSNTELNKLKLEGLFLKEYPKMPPFRNVKNDKYAFRYYGNNSSFSLKELLDNLLYQPSYENYKQVFFLDKEKNKKLIFNEEVDEIKDNKLYSLVIVSAPVDKVCGFAPYLDNKPFNQEISALEHEHITVKWCKEGYKEVFKTTQIKKDKEIKWEVPNQNDCEKSISYQMIKVLNERNVPINEYELKINGNELRRGDSVFIKDLKKVLIEVKTKDYETLEKNLDFTDTTLDRQIKVQLKKKVFKYTFVIPLKDGSKNIEYSYESEKELKKSPLEGYRVINKMEHNGRVEFKYSSFFDGFFKSKSFLIAVIMGVILGAGCWYFKGSIQKMIKLSVEKGNSIIRSSSESNNLKIKVDNSQNEQKGDSITRSSSESNNLKIEVDNSQNKQKGDGITNALKYLNRKGWNRDEMEQIKELKGLWDALNEYNFEKVLNFKKSLSESKKFKTILEVIKDIKDKKFPNSYNKEGDKEITVDKYIEKLQNKQKGDGTTDSEIKADNSQNEQKGDGITKALEYLDRRNVWNRDEMEQIGELKELWDALNKYNFKKVLSFEKSLSESKNFKTILEVIKDKEFPNSGSGYYNKESDKKINVDNYIKKLKERNGKK